MQLPGRLCPSAEKTGHNDETCLLLVSFTHENKTTAWYNSTQIISNCMLCTPSSPVPWRESLYYTHRSRRSQSDTSPYWLHWRICTMAVETPWPRLWPRTPFWLQARSLRRIIETKQNRSRPKPIWGLPAAIRDKQCLQSILSNIYRHTRRGLLTRSIKRQVRPASYCWNDTCPATGHLLPNRSDTSKATQLRVHLRKRRLVSA